MFIITIGLEEVAKSPTLREAFKTFHQKLMEKGKADGTMSLQYLETCWIQEVGKQPTFFNQLCLLARNSGWLKDGKLVI